MKAFLKRQGKEITRLMFYFVMLAFFMNIADHWMSMRFDRVYRWFDVGVPIGSAIIYIFLFHALRYCIRRFMRDVDYQKSHR